MLLHEGVLIMVYIKCGNLVTKQFIRHLLSFVPESDLKGLVSIVIKVHSPKGKYMSGRYHFSKDGKRFGRVFVYCLQIETGARYNWRGNNSNLFRLYMLEFANTFFHELGHHKDFIHGKLLEVAHKGIEINKRIRNLQRQVRRLITKREPAMKELNDVAIQFTLLHRFDTTPSEVDLQTQRLRGTLSELEKLQVERWKMHEASERYANEYAEKCLVEAINSGLITSEFSDMPFFGVMQKKVVHDTLDFIHSKPRESVWSGNVICIGELLAVLVMLRKRRLSKQHGVRVEYSYHELMEEVKKRNHTCAFPKGFKKVLLSVVEPYVYVSEKGRHYAYFSEEQIKKACEIHSRWFVD